MIYLQIIIAFLSRLNYVCSLLNLHTFMAIEQLSRMVHSIQSQADNSATHLTVEINREEFTLH